MKNLLTWFLIACIASSQLFGIAYCSKTTFDVVDYGAVGDGETDDSKAFVKAWEDVCGADNGGAPTLVIPEKKTFLLQPIKFEGPCKSNGVHVQILGKVVAPKTPDAWEECGTEWLQFIHVSNLMVDGSGEIDGQGSCWWDDGNPNQLSLKFGMKKESCQPPPKALYFHGCDNLKVSGFTQRNSPRAHIGISDCDRVHISHLTISAPGDSPNTDGIDIASSTHVHIEDSQIGTGDDCIAINGGCFDIQIIKVACGPGHGISVGSLGEHGSHDTVENVYVKDCSISGTQNGARIKTWQGGSGYARNITFEKIKLDGAQNPIIIDQYYCNGDHACKTQPSAVMVGDVRYIDFQGTSATEEAIKLDCSENSGCYNIVMDRISITSKIPGNNIYATCNNANGTSITTAPNVPCLKPGEEPPMPPPAPPVAPPLTPLIEPPPVEPPPSPAIETPPSPPVEPSPSPPVEVPPSPPVVVEPPPSPPVEASPPIVVEFPPSPPVEAPPSPPLDSPSSPPVEHPPSPPVVVEPLPPPPLDSPPSPPVEPPPFQRVEPLPSPPVDTPPSPPVEPPPSPLVKPPPCLPIEVPPSLPIEPPPSPLIKPPPSPTATPSPPPPSTPPSTTPLPYYITGVRGVPDMYFSSGASTTKLHVNYYVIFLLVNLLRIL